MAFAVPRSPTLLAGLILLATAGAGGADRLRPAFAAVRVTFLTEGGLRMGGEAASDQSFRELRKHALRPGNVRYFAYGSNLNSKVMEEMRGMRPLQAEPAVVDNYRLGFTLRGMPGLEPSFASAEPAEGASDQLHGILYTLTRSDWNKMAASEGVGMAYDLQTVSCVTYSGSTLEAVTLTTRKGPFRVEGVSPSPAYMGIIIQGARQAGLKDDYIGYLEAIPTSSTLFDSRMFSRYFRTGPE